MELAGHSHYQDKDRRDAARARQPHAVTEMPMTLRVILDKLVGCEPIEQVGYVIEGDAMWRETVSSCRRCGRVLHTSRRRLLEAEFWEDDALYLVPFAERS